MSERLDDPVVDPVVPGLAKRPPGWRGALDHALDWLHAHERWVFAGAVVLQLLVLTGMIAGKSVPFRTGREVLLRVVPVDPRDLLRGDYVTLSYDISRPPAGGIAGLELTAAPGDPLQTANRQVYVTLIPEQDGRHFRGETFSATPPPTGVLFIQGTLVNRFQIQYGIESFFVQEGHGKVYEDAVRERRLSAEVVVNNLGQAQLRGLRIE